MLEPITCRKDPTPSNLLQIISCSCDKSGCTSYCTYRKVGLKCAILCKKCNGVNCTNVLEPEVVLSEDEIDEELLRFSDAADDETDVMFTVSESSNDVNSDDEYEPDEKRIKKE
ncbi:hypothetical protein KPH14_007625 [Odynerus spinipes]|uniref:Tesmin/TSO1-like CXC domain-containing protein n=1 Tax=Odynerus spinipes TaxID=1348599 RepID=A0AAD9RHS8_9HYME|nr:hypothetical protein KPH14_007625 [Odynerus spinipes]